MIVRIVNPKPLVEVDRNTKLLIDCRVLICPRNGIYVTILRRQFTWCVGNDRGYPRNVCVCLSVITRRYIPRVVTYSKLLIWVVDSSSRTRCLKRCGSDALDKVRTSVFFARTNVMTVNVLVRTETYVNLKIRFHTSVCNCFPQ